MEKNSTQINSQVISPSDSSRSARRSLSRDQEFLKKVIGIIDANLERNDFTLAMLATEVKMSVSQLNRKLNALIGQPAGQLIRSYRLNRAAEMLKNKTGTIAQVSYQLGYNDQAYFTRAFKKQFGCSPGEFIKG
jgi:AraC-like DNA-binding protein